MSARHGKPVRPISTAANPDADSAASSRASARSLPVRRRWSTSATLSTSSGSTPGPSGRDPAEWVDPDGKEKGSSIGNNAAAIESLKAVGTDTFLLYRVRRLGQALSVLAERLVRSVRSVDAMRYRLLFDPFGPMGLAEAIVRQIESPKPSASDRTQAATVAAFSLSEIVLTMAHVAARMGKHRGGGPDLIPIFRELFARLDELTTRVLPDAEPDVCAYSALVKQQCAELVRTDVVREQHAD